MGFWNRLRKLGRLHEEIDEELRFHLEEKERRFMDDGMSRAEARREARKAFGSPDAVREDTRDAWIFLWADDLWRDLRFAARGLTRSPGFTMFAVATLALGIGGCGAMYAYLEQTAFVDQPYPEPQTLAVVEIADVENPRSTEGVTAAAFAAIQGGGGPFADIAGYNADGFALATAEEATVLDGVLATPNVFAVLGVRPLLGRAFEADGEAVLSERTWRRYFGGRADILGQGIELNGRAYTVVGVMPREFWRGRDLWIPLGRSVAEAGRVRTWARLSAAGGWDRAQAALGGVSEGLAQQGVALPPGRRLTVRDPFELTGGRVGVMAGALVAPVALVFLIACLNVAHLQVNRNLTRGREMALCRALGAGRLRLVRRLLAESLLLASLGGVGGAVVAVFGLRAIGAYMPAGSMTYLETLTVDGGVLLALLLLSAVSTMAIGILPALRVSGVKLTAALKEGARGLTLRNRSRRWLAASELALSMILLVGAGVGALLAQRVSEAPMGFDEQRLWLVRLSLRGQLVDAAARSEWAERTVQTMEAEPGILSAAIASEAPLLGGHRRRFAANGAAEATQQAEYRVITPGYFKTLRAEIRRGREFTPTDREGTPPTAIVNESFARRYFPGGALGKTLRVFDEAAERPLESREIVGVIADIRQTADARPAPPIIYVPFGQDPAAPLSLIVRTRAAPGPMGGDILARLQAPSQDLIVQSFLDYERAMGDSARTGRFLPLSMAIFALLGLLLAGVGLYGSVSRAVIQRTQEFGVRQALGAKATDVLGLVLRGSARDGAAGVAVGLGTAFAAARLVFSLLGPEERAAFAVDQVSRAEFVLVGVGAAVVLALVILWASYFPARRASQVAPMSALREQ